MAVRYEIEDTVQGVLDAGGLGQAGVNLLTAKSGASVAVKAVSGAYAAITAVTGTASTDTFTKTAHGLSNGTPVILSSLSGGTGLFADGRPYFVVATAANTFQLSTSSGGGAVNFTSDVSSVSVTRIILLDVYAAESGGSPTANPLTSDTGTGEISGFVEAADYDLVIYGTGVTTTKTQPIRRSPSGRFNVKSYGAKGDGTTIDTAAIQAAATAAATAGAGEVYFPAGTYKCAGIVYGNSLKFVGADSRATTLKLLNDSTSAIIGGTLGVIGTTGEPIQDLVVQDLTFDGDQANCTTGTTGAALLHAYSCARVHVLRCRFMNNTGYGMGLQGFPTAADGNKQGPQTDVYIEKCEFISNGYRNNVSTSQDGIDIKDSERVTLIDCYATGNSDKGFNLRGRFITATGCRAYGNVTGFDINAHNSVTTDDADTFATLVGCVAQANTGAGLACSSTEDSVMHISFVGCHARKNTGSGLFAADPPGTGLTKVTINGGGYIGNTSHGATLEATQTLSITGVTFGSNTGDGLRLTDVAEGAAVSGSYFRDNGGWGARSAGVSDRVAIGASRFKNNTSGTFTLTGANNLTTGANVTG